MGVCKCKQRNVTNQFCYVCRMNVCESCMVKDHQRCIIKSYVHWLQDSDYNSICLLCMESVSKGEVLRLTCYDLFHWDCFNAWALKHPEHTPASGYQCPDCKAPVFPPSKLVSPVADVIRQKFATVGWGRRCMGLPPQSSSQLPKTPKLLPVSQPQSNPVQAVAAPVAKMSHPSSSSTPLPPNEKANLPVAIETVDPLFTPISKPQKQITPKLEQVPSVNVTPKVKEVQKTTQSNYISKSASTPHKVIDSRRYDDSKINVSYDHDDNKYKRKGFTHWFGNLINLKSREQDKKGTKREAGLTFKRVFVAFVLISIGFMTVVYFMSTYGRNLAASDPMLDPMRNPNIKIEAEDPAVIGAAISR